MTRATNMHWPRWFAVIAMTVGLLWAFGSALADPLKRHPTNPRYFTDGSGKAIMLTGSTGHYNFVDGGNPIVPFDYTGYLNFLQAHNHNFIRLWRHEQQRGSSFPTIPFYDDPMPWQCIAGTPPTCTQYDLTQLNNAYFTRLRQRVIDAGARGIYVGIMLFEGWAVQNWPGSLSWDYNAFKSGLNNNSINGDPNGDGTGLEIFQGSSGSAITTVQKAYIQRVIDTVNDLDNVLYEIGNEIQIGSKAWQYDLINFIKAREALKPKQHPVGMTILTNQATVLGGFQWGTYADLNNSPADWISPGASSPDVSDNWNTNPPDKGGNKVVIVDTDHIGGVTVDQVWKVFMRGNHFILMDTGLPISGANNCCPMPADAEAIRTNMGRTLTYANRINLAQMPPRGNLCSSAFCLVNPGQEYLVYLPSGGSVNVNLTGGASSFSVEWFNISNGVIQTGSDVPAGNPTLTAPFSGPVVLYLSAGRDTTPPNPPSGLRVQ